MVTKIAQVLVKLVVNCQFKPWPNQGTILNHLKTIYKQPCFLKGKLKKASVSVDFQEDNSKLVINTSYKYGNSVSAPHFSR